MLTTALLQFTDADLEALTFPQGRLVPYIPDVIPQSVLQQLYSELQRTHALARIFWQTPDSPVVTSWTHFQAWCVEHPVFLVLLGHEIVGLVWLTGYVPRWHAHLGLWYRRTVRGPVAWNATRTLARWCFMRLELHTLWAMTPYRDGLRHAAWASTCHVYPNDYGHTVHQILHATLKGYARINGKARDVYIVRWTRAWFLEQDRLWQAVQSFPSPLDRCSKKKLNGPSMSKAII